MADASKKIGKSVGEAYGELEGRFIHSAAPTFPGMPPDHVPVIATFEQLAVSAKKMKEQPKLFSSTSKKILAGVEEILDRGSPNDLAGGLLGNTETASKLAAEGKLFPTVKLRLLEARRFLDDQLSNKNFDSLGKYDKEVIQELRDGLTERLHKEFAASPLLVDADNLYKQYKDDVASFFDGLRKRGEDGVNLSKLYNDVNSQSTRGMEFDKKIAAVVGFLRERGDELDDVAKEAGNKVIAKLEQLRDLGDMAGLKQHLGKSQGGPSGKAINTALQIAGGIGTGGTSLLAMPITNTTAYVGVLDKLAGYGEAGSRYVRVLKDAKARGAAALTATHMMLMKSEPEYREALEGN